MTPEYETWGQVLQFSLPDRAEAASTSGDVSPRRAEYRRLPEADVEAQVTTDNADEPAASAEERPDTSGEGAGRRLLDRQMQAALGRQLRAMYDDIASEPVPTRFLELLDALESKEKDR